MGIPASAFSSGELGFFGEGPVDFDPIAILQGLISARHFAEDAYRSVRQIDAREILIPRNLAQCVCDRCTGQHH